MKKSIIVSLVLLSCSFLAKAQEINWQNINTTSRHQVSVHIGADFGTVYGIGYGYRIGSNHPVVVGAKISAPFGKSLMDDFKLEVTGQTEVWHSDGLSFAVQPALIMRRYQSSAALIYNIGAGLTTTFGYFKNKWGVGVEANYDRNFATYLEHFKLKEYYPDIQDGWYRSTGGTFKFGVKGNYWIKSVGLSAKIGKVYGQNFSNNPTIPFYAEFSVLNRL